MSEWSEWSKHRVVKVVRVRVVKVTKSGQKCSKVVKVIRVVVKELPSTKMQGIGMLPSNVIMTTPYRVAKVVIKVKVGI